MKRWWRRLKYGPQRGRRPAQLVERHRGVATYTTRGVR